MLKKILVAYFNIFFFDLAGGTEVNNKYLRAVGSGRECNQTHLTA
jgi:hypothetical protein